MVKLNYYVSELKIDIIHTHTQWVIRINSLMFVRHPDTAVMTVIEKPINNTKEVNSFREWHTVPIHCTTT